MNTQVIIYAKAGHVPPRGYLQTALKNCPTYYGLATREVVEGTPVIEVIGEKKTLDVDKLVETLEALKDTDTLLVLGNMAKEFDGAGDMMPFTFKQVSEADGQEVEEIVLATAYEGDLPNYSKPGSGHSDEFNMWDDFIFPEVMDKFEASADLPTFYGKLRASNFQQALLNPVGHRAQFFFLPLEGEPIICSKNELGGEFDWGGTSNCFGWGAPTVVEKASATVNKARNRLAGLIAGTSPPGAPAAQPEAAPTKADPPGVHRVGGTIVVDKNSTTKATSSVAAAAPKADTAVKEPYTMMDVPSKLQGNARNSWIRLMLGLSPQDDMPQGHNSKNFKVAVPNNLLEFAKMDVSTRDSVRELAVKVKAFQNAGSVTAGMKEAHTQASKTNSGKPPVTATEPSASDYLPTMSADDKKGSVDLVIDWATRSKGPTSLEIQKMEAKWAPFSEQMGIKFEDLFSWTVHDAKKLAKTYPDAMALAFIEMRKKFVEWNGIPTEVKPDEVKNPSTKPTEKVTPSGAPPSQSTGTPAKKSRLASLTSGQAA